MPIDRSRIKKGMYLTSTQPPPECKRCELAPEFAEFEGAARVADDLAAADRSSQEGIRELSRHLLAVRDQLEAIKGRGRKGAPLASRCACSWS